jgi:hypothetical protein
MTAPIVCKHDRRDPLHVWPVEYGTGSWQRAVDAALLIKPSNNIVFTLKYAV